MRTKKHISISPAGYGHWKVIVRNYRKKDREFITNDSIVIDNYKSEDIKISNKGYKQLIFKLRFVHCLR